MGRTVNDGQNQVEVDQRPRARVVLFGMRCAFTEPVLNALLTAPNVDLRVVVLPESAESLPVPVSPTDPPLDTIRTNQVRMLGLADRSHMASPAFRAALEAIGPDLIVIACFPWRLPDWLLVLPPHGCLNVHPSLLPDGRGPEPVFWAFRWGLAETGVTLHVMDAGFDTGPVVAQRRIVVPENATMPALECDLARIGADLLTDTLPAVLAGSVSTSPQAGLRARYARTPRADDLLVDTSWSAHDAARFIRAIAQVYGPVPLLVRSTGQRLSVDAVIGVTDDASMPDPVSLQGPDALIRFAQGTLVCRLAASHQPLRFHVPGTR